MAKVEIPYTQFFQETMQVMTHDGLLLASLGPTGKPNTMTIGWGVLGAIWGRPMWVVLVRPSRYTYQCIETTGDFTVNVPPPEMAEIVSFCGTVSGRDHDKFAEKGLTAQPGRQVKSPSIAECVIHYECQVVHRNDVIPAQLDQAIQVSAYPAGDFHRLYFGEIVAAYADEDAARRLAGGDVR